MVQDIKQEVLSPEELLLKEQIDGLLKNVDPGHGEPLQVELADRLDKTVNDFHDEVASIMESIKTNTEEQRSKLKEMWEHRNDEKPQSHKSAPTEEQSEELSLWEKKLENKKTADKGVKPKVAKLKESKKEESNKKGFFKRKK